MEFLFTLGGILIFFFIAILAYCNTKSADMEDVDADYIVLYETFRIFKFYVIGVLLFYLVIFIQTTSYIDVDVQTQSINMIGNGDFLVEVDGEHYLIDNEKISLKNVPTTDDESITYHIIAYKENSVSKAFSFDEVVKYFNMPNTNDESTINVSDLEKQYKAINVSHETLEDFLKQK